MRKLRVLIAGLAVTAAAGLVHPGIARATDYNEWKTEDGLCMGVQAGNVVAGTAIISWACDGTSNQSWAIDTRSGAPNTYLIRNESNPNYCLSVFAKATYMGAPLVIWPCKDFSDNQDQRWSFTNVPNIPIENAPSTPIYNANSGLQILPSGPQGSQIVQWDGRVPYYWAPRAFVIVP
jgi:hypothetical protein